MIETEKEKKSGFSRWKGAAREFFYQDFFRNGLVHWVLIGAFFVNLTNWILIAFFIRPVDFPIILHYNVYFGVDILGSWWEAYFLPGTGTILGIINLVLAYSSYRRQERIATYLFLLGAFIIQIGISIAVGSIIKINY